MSTDARPPLRLPAGVRLPDGRALTFSARRGCGCADCEAAFRALDSGELILPADDEEGLPWRT